MSRNDNIDDMSKSTSDNTACISYVANLPKPIQQTFRILSLSPSSTTAQIQESSRYGLIITEI